MNTYNGWTNYATRCISLHCNDKEDVLFLKDWIEDVIYENDIFKQMDGLLGDLVDNNINRQELENSFED